MNDNNIDALGLGAWEAGVAEELNDMEPSFGVGVHLTPTNKRRPYGASVSDKHRAQRACSLCKRKGTSHLCSGCRQDGAGEVFICGPKSARTCFLDHLAKDH